MTLAMAGPDTGVDPLRARGPDGGPTLAPEAPDTGAKKKKKRNRADMRTRAYKRVSKIELGLSCYVGTRGTLDCVDAAW